MSDLLDTLSGAIVPRMPAPSDWPSSGRWRGDSPYKDLKFDTVGDMRAAVSGADVQPQQSSQPSGGLYDTISGAIGSAANLKPAATPPEPTPLRDKLDKTYFSPGESAGTQVGKTLLNQASGVGASIMGGWRGLAALASGASLDEAVRQVQSPELAGGQTAQAYQGGSNLERVVNAPGALVGTAGNWAGEKVSDITGSPAAGAAVNTAIQAAPLLLLKGRGATPVTIPKLVGEGSIADRPAIGSVEPSGVPTIVPKEPVPVALGAPVPKVTEAGVEPAPAATFSEPPKVAPGAPLPTSDQAARAAVLQRIGLGDATQSARTSALTGDPLHGASDFQTTKFDEPAGHAAVAQFQAERDALESHAQSIVDDTGGTSGTEASVLHARGNTILQPLSALRQWFETNTRALYKEADARAQGVPSEMPRTLDYVSGDQADFLGTQEGQSLLKGVQARMKSLGMLNAEEGPQPAGIPRATAMQAEQLKQYLNNQWQPRTARLIQGMKDSIDDDVTSAAGADIYAKARSMRAMRSAVFENDVTDANGRTIPNGIGKLVDASSNKLELVKPVEQIPDAVAGLPADQLAHVVQTLQNVPPEIQPQAAAALAEVKAHFANRLANVGGNQVQWNAKGVTKFLNDNSARLPQVFTPEEMASMQDLNDAGHILAVNRNYPGAAAQTANAMKRGLMASVVQRAATWAGAGAGSLAGSMVGAPGAGAAVGASISDIAGAKAAVHLGEKAALKQWQNRLTPISSFPK